MQTQTVLRTGPLTPRDHAAAYHPITIATEWTPTPASSVPIKSTWRDAIGVPLTNRRINRHIREGWYGEAKRLRLLEKDKGRHVRQDIIYRCPCGRDEVRYYRWSYLPKAGYYCTVCVASYRSNAERERRLSKELRERIERAVMERYV